MTNLTEIISHLLLSSNGPIDDAVNLVRGILSLIKLDQVSDAQIHTVLGQLVQVIASGKLKAL
jgi:hypothetical protein